MINELDALESKVIQLVSLCQELRAENTQLRQRLATVDGEKKVLQERMETARERIVQLAQRLPEDKTKV